MDKISYADFSKLDIRIGKILSADDVEGADRLLKISVDIGEETPRTACAGLKQYYSPEDLVGKTVIFLANLEARKIRGIESNGMILAASTEGFTKVRLLTSDDDMPPGASIS